MGHWNVLDFSSFSHFNNKKIACRVKVGLKKILTSQFQTCLFLAFIILKFFKFYTQYIINPMEA